MASMKRICMYRVFAPIQVGSFLRPQRLRRFVKMVLCAVLGGLRPPNTAHNRKIYRLFVEYQTYTEKKRMRLSNWLRRGEARVKETRLGAIVERLQQLLAYSMTCFLPGCADPDLRHPLLDVLPDKSVL